MSLSRQINLNRESTINTNKQLVNSVVSLINPAQGNHYPDGYGIPTGVKVYETTSNIVIEDQDLMIVANLMAYGNRIGIICKLVDGHWIYHSTITTVEQITAFTKSRTTVSELCIHSNTISTTNANLSGTMSAVCFAELPDLTQLNYSNLPKYSFGAAYARSNVPLADGIVMHSYPVPENPMVDLKNLNYEIHRTDRNRFSIDWPTGQTEVAWKIPDVYKVARAWRVVTTEWQNAFPFNYHIHIRHVKDGTVVNRSQIGAVTGNTVIVENPYEDGNWMLGRDLYLVFTRDAVEGQADMQLQIGVIDPILGDNDTLRHVLIIQGSIGTKNITIGGRQCMEFLPFTSNIPQMSLDAGVVVSLAPFELFNLLLKTQFISLIQTKSEFISFVNTITSIDDNTLLAFNITDPSAHAMGSFASTLLPLWKKAVKFMKRQGVDPGLLMQRTVSGLGSLANSGINYLQSLGYASTFGHASGRGEEQQIGKVKSLTSNSLVTVGELTMQISVPQYRQQQLEQVRQKVVTQDPKFRKLAIKNKELKAQLQKMNQRVKELEFSLERKQRQLDYYMELYDKEMSEKQLRKTKRIEEPCFEQIVDNPWIQSLLDDHLFLNQKYEILTAHIVLRDMMFADMFEEKHSTEDNYWAFEDCLNKDTLVKWLIYQKERKEGRAKMFSFFKNHSVFDDVYEILQVRANNFRHRVVNSIDYLNLFNDGLVHIVRNRNYFNPKKSYRGPFNDAVDDRGILPLHCEEIVLHIGDKFGENGIQLKIKESNKLHELAPVDKDWSSLPAKEFIMPELIKLSSSSTSDSNSEDYDDSYRTDKWWLGHASGQKKCSVIGKVRSPWELKLMANASQGNRQIQVAENLPVNGLEPRLDQRNTRANITTNQIWDMVGHASEKEQPVIGANTKASIIKTVPSLTKQNQNKLQNDEQENENQLKHEAEEAKQVNLIPYTEVEGLVKSHAPTGDAIVDEVTDEDTANNYANIEYPAEKVAFRSIHWFMNKTPYCFTDDKEFDEFCTFSHFVLVYQEDKFCLALLQASFTATGSNYTQYGVFMVSDKWQPTPEQRLNFMSYCLSEPRMRALYFRCLKYGRKIWVDFHIAKDAPIEKFDGPSWNGALYAALFARDSTMIYEAEFISKTIEYQIGGNTMYTSYYTLGAVGDITTKVAISECYASTYFKSLSKLLGPMSMVIIVYSTDIVQIYEKWYNLVVLGVTTTGVTGAVPQIWLSNESSDCFLNHLRPTVADLTRRSVGVLSWEKLQEGIVQYFPSVPWKNHPGKFLDTDGVLQALAQMPSDELWTSYKSKLQNSSILIAKLLAAKDSLSDAKKRRFWISLTGAITASINNIYNALDNYKRQGTGKTGRGKVTVSMKDVSSKREQLESQIPKGRVNFSNRQSKKNERAVQGQRRNEVAVKNRQEYGQRAQQIDLGGLVSNGQNNPLNDKQEFESDEYDDNYVSPNTWN